MYTISQSGGKIKRNHIACNTDKETDESWDTYIYNMNDQFWAVGWVGL